MLYACYAWHCGSKAAFGLYDAVVSKAVSIACNGACHSAPPHVFDRSCQATKLSLSLCNWCCLPGQSVHDQGPLVAHFLSLALQVGFFQIVGLPLFKAMADVFEDTRPLYEGAMANCQAWQDAVAADDALVASA